MPEKCHVAQWNVNFSTEIGSYRLADAVYQFSASHSDSNYPFAPPLQVRLAHDPTFMLSAQFCDFNADKCCCSGKHLHKFFPFNSCYLVHCIPMQRNPTMNKCCRSRGISQKCCLLLAACPHFVQMLALALPSIKSVIIQRKRRRNTLNKSFRVRRSRPFCMCFLVPPARPLTADPAQSKFWAAHHSSLMHVRRRS